MEGKINYALFCDYANSTREGKLNIIGTFTEIFAEQLPIALPNFFLVLNLSVDAGENHNLKVTAPDGHEITIDFNLEGEGRKDLNQPISLVAFPFTKEGENKFLFNLDGKKAGETSINVNIKK